MMESKNKKLVTFLVVFGVFISLYLIVNFMFTHKAQMKEFSIWTLNFSIVPAVLITVGHILLAFKRSRYIIITLSLANFMLLFYFAGFGTAEEMFDAGNYVPVIGFSLSVVTFLSGSFLFWRHQHV